MRYDIFHKKIRYIYAVLTVLLVASCIESGPKLSGNEVLTVRPVSLDLSQTSIHFNSSDKGVQKINVYSTDVNWEFTSTPKWLTISPSSGGSGVTTVTVTCSENPEVVRDRMALFYFRSKDGEWDFETPVSVTQARSIHVVVPESDSVNVSWEQKSYLIKVQSNNSTWTIEAQSDFASWGSVSRKINGIEISCMENTLHTPRTGHIILRTMDETRTITIVQEAAVFNIAYNRFDNPSSIAFQPYGGTGRLSIQVVESEYWTASSDESWITLNPTRGIGSSTIDVVVNPNSQPDLRNGKITIVAQDYGSIISVLQKGSVHEVYSPTLNFNSSGGEMNVYLSSGDTYWHARTECDWIRVDEDPNRAHSYHETLEIEVLPNNTLFSRTDSVVIESKRDTVVLKVVQSAPYLIVNTDQMSFTGERSTQKILVDTDREISVYNPILWLSSQIVSDGILLTASSYSGTGTREGDVTVRVKGLTGVLEKTIHVAQFPQGAEFVDLGLSVLWGVKNLGAQRVEDAGSYYAWGEIEADKADGYDWSTYKYCNGSNNSLTKYCPDKQYGNNGYRDSHRTLQTEDEAAYYVLGNGWRTPTHDEFQELIDNCNWNWTLMNGVNGYRVSGKEKGYEDNSIFLPAGGYKSGKSLTFSNVEGYYWTSNCYDYRPYNGMMAILSSNSRSVIDDSRCYGLPIRPVINANKDDSGGTLHIYPERIDLFLGQEIPKITLTLEYPGEDGLTHYLPQTKVWTSSNKNVVTVTGYGEITVVGAGYSRVCLLYEGKKAYCDFYITDPLKEYEVDLGLSVNWSSYNLGAYYPWEMGDLYAWGESLIKSKYSWSNYIHALDDNSCKSYNRSDGKTVLEEKDDAAHQIIGDGWRMPTSDECQELINADNCTWEKISLYGVGGFKVTSKKEGYTDKSIFIPLGDASASSLSCNLWTSSLVVSDPYKNARTMYVRWYEFSPNTSQFFYERNISSHQRYEGYYIRPVR